MRSNPHRARKAVLLPLLALIHLCLYPSAHALTVNRVNGGANVIYIDFSVPGRVVPLELVRAYNSITALSEQSGWLGAFGWGWTSPFETTLTVTPERHVILRDGSSGNTILFKPEKDDPKARQTFFDSVRIAYFEQTLGRKMNPEELQKSQLPDKILTRLKGDPAYRAEMAARFGVKTPVPKGELLVSSEYGYQTLQFKNNQWLREKDGVLQYFDKEGRMIRQADKNDFSFEFRYAPGGKGQLVEISDQDRSMSLKFTWRQDRVVEVVDNRNQRARYTYDTNGNLTQVIDSNNQTYIYKYENRKFPHLLTKIEYVTESVGKDQVLRELRYDENGLVTYHREKDGTETIYTYGKSSSDPENSFTTKMVKKGRGLTEEQFDEYVLRVRPDGNGKYLYKQDTRTGGVTTTTIYATCCGKPLQVMKANEVTNYKYYENGLLAEKVGPREDIRLEYDPKWKKVSKVRQNGTVSLYEYDPRGNLVKASNSRNERVALKYDRWGRILEMTDSDKRQISFRYGDNGKPTVIEEKGVGTIRIEYDNDGRIRRTATVVAGEKGRTPSEARSQEVVRRVMRGFQTLLDIIRPAGVSLISG